ncbi:hypothetical protein B0H21DRAFT_214051 [Amylocystis lapponica]|nr:hypothetical protein B0H21DRAFT_214051 [Amylocystis lapponica]
MISTAPRRGHRKRISALRLSSDSTVSALPAYTSPPWNRSTELDDVSDRPPDYPDSAEEADEDTDTDDTDSNVLYIQPAPSPRRPRRSPHPRSTRRQSSSSGDPYLDSLLARSVHALEMSNVLLQSSMSTQSSLSAVLSSDSIADRSLEARAQLLSSRITGNRGLHDTWMEDLDEISQSVESLVSKDQEEADGEGKDTFDEQGLHTMSRSLPSSGLAERVHKGHMRRPSLDLRNATAAQLQYSNHERSHFVAPPPRALTMYMNSSDDPELITLPPTLGLRSTSHFPPTPLPSETFSRSTPDLPSSESVEHTKRIMDVLSSYVTRSPPSPCSTPSSISSSRKPSSVSGRSGRSSSTSSHTVRRTRQSKSPPAPLSIKVPSPSRSTSTFRSRSVTPHRSSSPPRQSRPMTPPIEELSASSTSSSSDTMHVDRTVQSLRQILTKQPVPPAASSSKLKLPDPPPPRPAFLQPPSVSPASGTSTATASISRLFTKARHSSSTRPPSPPRQSSLKNHSRPPTPLTPNSPTLLTVPDNPLRTGLRSPASSSGRSTPKRISFAELPESYAGSKPGGASRFRDKARDRDKHGKGKGKGKAERDAEQEGTGWWTGWLLGAAGTGSGSGLSVGAAREERYPRSPTWSVRPGFGNSLEDWGA